WLVAQQQPDGCLTPDRGQVFMYQHAIGTFALAEAVATARHSEEKPDARYVAALEKAVKFIQECQDTTRGGWRYTPHTDSDTSVSGWVVLALKTAREADVKVDPGCVEQALRFFKSCEGADGRTGYTGPGPSTEATTGVGMLVHHFLLGKSDTPLVKAA